MWISSALRGRTHELTAARTHRMVKTCIRLRIPTLADMTYTRAGSTVAVPPGTSRARNSASARDRRTEPTRDSTTPSNAASPHSNAGDSSATHDAARAGCGSSQSSPHPGAAPLKGSLAARSGHVDGLDQPASHCYGWGVARRLTTRGPASGAGQSCSRTSSVASAPSVQSGVSRYERDALTRIAPAGTSNLAASGR